MTTRDEAIKIVAQTMTVHADLAVRKLAEVDPNQRGIDWWTALGILIDGDYHLAVTEPVWDALEFLPESRKPFITPVTLTLLYSGLGGVRPGEVSPASVHEWCNVLASWKVCTCSPADGVHAYDCPLATKADL